MKKLIFLFSFLLLVGACILYTACNKVDSNGTNVSNPIQSKQTLSETRKISDVNSTTSSLESRFSPSGQVTVTNGILVFPTKEAFNTTISEIAYADRQAVNSWESSLGFTSQANLFDQIIRAESALFSTYENMSIQQQQYYATLPEPHSTIYQQSLNNGLIKIVNDPTGNYYDYAVCKPSLSVVLNQDGFVSVEGKILQYTSSAKKIIKNGDFSKVSVIKQINSNYNQNNMVVTVLGGGGPDATCTKTWITNSTTTAWTVSGKKRWRAFIEGNSQPYAYVTPIFECCAIDLITANNFRTDAQRKNFWGNFVYRSDFMPALDFTGTWETNVTITGNEDCNSTGSVLSTIQSTTKSVPQTNRGFFPLYPNGLSSLSTNQHFANAFMITNINFSATYNGTAFTIN